MAKGTEEQRPLSITELTRQIKRRLEGDYPAVRVEGEIGNFTVSARGHAYFQLKDENAVLSCVLFSGARQRLDFRPAEGDRVLAEGSLSVYEARGQYQLIARTLRQQGLGDLYRRFLELKRKLEEEGLFEAERKRPLPAHPRRIGVVTSPSGAAVRDIINVIRRRFSGVELYLSPCLVQGDAAPGQIVRALGLLERFRLEDGEGVDVVIVGRGGGSIEDLWAFNDEAVARAIAACPIPVVSAVGHETDFTIADFVADLRAPTPSAAAELVVGEMEALRDRVGQYRERLARALNAALERRRMRLDKLMSSWALRQPIDRLRQAEQRLDDLQERARRALEARQNDATQRLANLRGRLEALNPERVLERGYSIVTLARNGRVVTREGQARSGDQLRIRLSEGELRAATLPPGEDFLDGLPAE